MNQYQVNQVLLQATVNVLRELPAKDVLPILNELLALKPTEVKQEAVQPAPPTQQ